MSDVLARMLRCEHAITRCSQELLVAADVADPFNAESLTRVLEHLRVGPRSIGHIFSAISSIRCRANAWSCWPKPAAPASTIQDDGQGFAEGHASSGMGLSNMRDRVAKFNGQLEINTGPGFGTEIRAVLPRPDREA